MVLYHLAFLTKKGLLQAGKELLFIYLRITFYIFVLGSLQLYPTLFYIRARTQHTALVSYLQFSYNEIIRFFTVLMLPNLQTVTVGGKITLNTNIHGNPNKEDSLPVTKAEFRVLLCEFTLTTTYIPLTH